MIIRQICVRHGRAAWRSSIPSQTYQLGHHASRQTRRYANKTPSSTKPRILSSPKNTNGEIPQTRVAGHPEEPSSILDTTQHAPTAQTRELEHQIESFEKETQSIQSELSGHVTAKSYVVDQEIESTPSTDLNHEETKTVQKAEFSSSSASQNQQVGGIPYANLYQYNQDRRHIQLQEKKGTHLTETYSSKTLIHNPPRPAQVTLSALLANQTHLGHATALWNPANSQYIFGVRDGIHIISLDTTYAYLQRASKIVQAVARNGGMILFVGTRKGQEEMVIRAASRAKGYHIYDRWTPGTLTNGQQILGECALKVVDLNDNELPDVKPALNSQGALRPDLVVVFNPIENEVCLHECGIYNVPTIGIIDTDANPSWVTYPIPANDDSRRSVALIAGVLSRAAEMGQLERLALAKNGESTYDTGAVRKLIQTWKKDVGGADEGSVDAGFSRGRIGERRTSPRSGPVIGTGAAGGAAATGGMGVMDAVMGNEAEEITTIPA